MRIVILEEIQYTVFPVDNSRINRETLEEVVRLLQKAIEGKKSERPERPKGRLIEEGGKEKEDIE